MRVEYSKQSLKDLAAIPSKLRIPIEKFVFEELPCLNNTGESQKIESLKGYSNFFKARFGNYRIGLFRRGDILVIKRILHRKEIYRYFP
jgi:mRNA interferase RelE/StbE